MRHGPNRGRASILEHGRESVLLERKIINSEHKFKHDGQAQGYDGNFQPARVILDTGCDHEGFITKTFVVRLGMQSAVYMPESTAEGNKPLPVMRCACGRLIYASGAIKLYWILHANSTKVFQTQFYVYEMAGSDHLDLVVGAKTIEKEGLLTPNHSPILTLTQHEPKSKGK